MAPFDVERSYTTDTASFPFMWHYSSSLSQVSLLCLCRSTIIPSRLLSWDVVSGALILAKNKNAASELADAFRQQRVQKYPMFCVCPLNQSQAMHHTCAPFTLLWQICSWQMHYALYDEVLYDSHLGLLCAFSRSDFISPHLRSNRVQITKPSSLFLVRCVSTLAL